ncbi:MAG: hydroxyethylthiazole kinase [Euryarchaeota archaeon]|nr:hydroxyethylthiazole kinase [Euryarchaeota archaeon]
MDKIADKAADALVLLREKKPLVHHITNWVTISDCASITRSLGALPVMAHAEEEVEEMVGIAGALVLNIGTLTPTLVSSMIKAGRRANRNGTPVILDAVGVGATRLRTDSAKEILAEVKIRVIKGNSGEIATLAGARAEVRGVESISAEGDAMAHAKALAKSEGCTVVATGAEDIVTDGSKAFMVRNGHPRMGEVVGTGCMAASVIGAFSAIEPDGTLAACYAMIVYDIAGEIAAADAKGPGSMKQNLFDAIMTVGAEVIRKGARVDAK